MCVLAAPGVDNFTDALAKVGCPMRVLRAGPDLNPVLLAALVRDIRRFRPDVVHTHLVHADLYGQLAASVAGVPAVSSVHGAPRFYRRQPYLSARRLAGRRARLTIAISESVAGFLRELDLVPSERIRVVRYGIDANRWEMSEDDRVQARKAFGVSADIVVIGVASRLVQHKGHAPLLDAFANALAAAPEARLLVAGTGPLLESLRNQAARIGCLEQVRFLGFVHDMRSFMGACDVLAFPTAPEIGEGFGLASLEAMAAGRPVVATAVGPLPEIVVDGQTGFLVRSGSPEAMTMALVQLVRDGELRKRMGGAARSRTIECFALDTMVDRTVSVYESVL